MTSEQEPAVKMIPLQLVIIISVFMFFGGAIGGILFCGRFGHEKPTPGARVLSGEGLATQIEKLEKEVAVNPGSAGSWTQLGNLYFDSDQYEKSIEAYRKSLSLEPNNPDVWTDLGIMYRLSGQPRKAIEAFDRAIAIDPKHANSRFNKGVVLLNDLEDEVSAIKEWEDLIRINPSYELSDGKHIDEVILHYRMKQGHQGQPATNQPREAGKMIGEGQAPH